MPEPTTTMYLRVEIPDGTTEEEVLAAMDDVPAEIWREPGDMTSLAVVTEFVRSWGEGGIASGSGRMLSAAVAQAIGDRFSADRELPEEATGDLATLPESPSKRPYGGKGLR